MTIHTLAFNPALWRSLHSLIHPISIASIALLLVNDHLLKYHFASWWTGKLSDFAGLIFAPIICAVLVAFIIPKSHPKQENLVASIAFGLTGLIFALSNTIPAANRMTETVWAFFADGPVEMWRDPTDLIALPALFIGWQIWKTASNRPPRRPVLQLAVLTIGSLAAMATSESASDQGINCIMSHDGDLYALNDWVHYYEYYVLRGGEQEWEKITVAPHGPVSQCPQDNLHQWQHVDPSQPNLIWRVTRSKSIERSTDGGQRWREMVDLRWISSLSRARALGRGYQFLISYIVRPPPGPIHSYYDADTGHLWVAMGLDGILRISHDGTHKWIPVGNHHLAGVQTIQISTIHWWPHLFLGAISAMLGLPLALASLQRSCLVTFLGILPLAMWAAAAANLSLSPFPTRLTHFQTSDTLAFSTMLCVIIITAIIYDRFGSPVPSTLEYRRLSSFVLVTFALFMYPYLRWWAVGSNPLTYSRTTYIAIGAVFAWQFVIMVTVRRWYPRQKTPYDWFREYVWQAIYGKG